MDTLLVIGGRPDTVRKAKELGLSVVLVQHKELLTLDAARHADAAILANYTHWPTIRPLIEAAHEVWSFSRSLSLADQGMEIVGRVNDLFGLVGTPYAVSHLFRDKLAMRQHLAEVGMEVVTADPVDGPDDIRAFGERQGYPVVVKPIDGTGSRGVVVIPDATDVERSWEAVARLRADREGIARYYPVTRFMAEEYIDGEEYAVESFSFGGRHVIVGITERLAAGVVEIGHAEPARMRPDDEAKLVDYVSSFLGAMGLRDGVACTEVKMSAKGPRIVESQDRAPGDRVMDLVELAYGFDMERYAVGWPFGLVPELLERPPARRGAATRFLLADPGRVTSIDGLTEVQACPGFVDLDIKVEVGGEVPRLADNFDRIGQLLATGADTEEAVRVCEDLTSRVVICTSATMGDE